MQLANNNYRLLQPRPYPARLSLVIPMYNEGLVVPFLTSGLEQFMTELRGEAEVVLVNDGSTDSTLQQIVEWAQRNQRVKVVNFTPTFARFTPSTAGLWYATGEKA